MMKPLDPLSEIFRLLIKPKLAWMNPAVIIRSRIDRLIKVALFVIVHKLTIYSICILLSLSLSMLLRLLHLNVCLIDRYNQVVWLIWRQGIIKADELLDMNWWCKLVGKDNCDRFGNITWVGNSQNFLFKHTFLIFL